MVWILSSSPTPVSSESTATRCAVGNQCYVPVLPLGSSPLRSPLVPALWALIVWLAAAVPQAIAQERPSLLEVPVELDLSPAFAAAERLVPRQTGGPGWRDWHGVKVRYQAWRGPLALELRGDTLLVQAHARYRAQARKDLIGKLGVSAGCGVNEPPRQALIGAAIRLEPAPDWSLRPKFRLLPTRFFDRCEVTALDIDVSPLVAAAFEQRMGEAMTNALRELTPALDALRTTASRGWAVLQAPQQLTPGLWLTARPEGLGLAPPIGRGNRLATAIGITMRPAITTTEPAAAPLRPLPPLTLFRPTATGMRFDLALELSLPVLSDTLAKRLAKQTFTVRDVPLAIRNPSLSVSGGRLALMADIEGEIPGRLDLRARPELDPDTGQVRFADLDYVFDSEHPDADLILALLYEPIRQRLEQMADDALAEELASAKSALAAQIARWLADRATLDLSGMRLTALTVELAEQRVRLRGKAQGQVAVVLR